jgi:hypothetical protein
MFHFLLSTSDVITMLLSIYEGHRLRHNLVLTYNPPNLSPNYNIFVDSN